MATNTGPDNRQTMEGYVAGFLLLLTSVAAAAMVWTRIQADVDQTSLEEMLVAIDENLLWYIWHGTARAFFGGLLIGSASLIRPAMSLAQGWQLRWSSLLLSLGGTAMIISGVLVIFIASVYWTDTYNIEQFDEYRKVTGSIGNTLIGLAIIGLCPVQWRLGGMMKLVGGLAPITGLGMIIVWWDSLNVHQLTGTLFLLWMLGTAFSLIFGWFGRSRVGGSDPASEPVSKF